MTNSLILTFAIKNRRAVPVIAVIGWMFMSLGCHYSPSHPPTFADFHRLGPGMLDDEKKLNAQLAVFGAAMFLPNDFEMIRARGGAHELVGAALSSKVGDKSLPMLTREALLHGSNDPVVLTGVAVCLAREIANDVYAASSTPELHQVLTALERLEPQNGLPLCFRAYLQLKQGDTNAARLSLKAAIQKPVLRIHGSELRRCVTQAAIAANYPRYTAAMLAIGTLGMSTEVSIVGNQLLKDPQLDRSTAEACLELGRRHEAQAKMFIDQLIAFSLQKRALEFLKPPGFEKELQRMQDAKEKIRKATVFLDSPSAHAVSERQWLAYYDTLFKKSESEAVNQLASEMNYKL